MAAIAHRNNFCRLYQRNKSASIVKFRQASNLWKRVLEAAKLAYATVAQKMKFSIKETADLVTFTEEILNGKLHFLCSVTKQKSVSLSRNKVLVTFG